MYYYIRFSLSLSLYLSISLSLYLSLSLYIYIYIWGLTPGQRRRPFFGTKILRLKQANRHNTYHIEHDTCRT